MELTERVDLRGSQPCWLADDNDTATSDAFPTTRVDIAIVGAGVTGAMLAWLHTGNSAVCPARAIVSL